MCATFVVMPWCAFAAVHAKPDNAGIRNYTVDETGGAGYDIFSASRLNVFQRDAPWGVPVVKRTCKVYAQIDFD